jgi:hypothetical protein
MVPHRHICEEGTERWVIVDFSSHVVKELEGGDGDGHGHCRLRVMVRQSIGHDIVGSWFVLHLKVDAK